MIITLYSSSFDAGCTMAAVNIGVLFSQMGKKTLIVDWDVENPKLMSYIRDFSQSPTVGIYDLFSNYKKMIEGDEKITPDKLNTFQIKGTPTSLPNLAYIPAFKDKDFNNKKSIDWEKLYIEYYGGAFVNYLRKFWENEYEIILIISEKGFSDAAALCVMQLPQIVVLMVDLREKNIEKSGYVANSIASNSSLEGDEKIILPIPSKISDSERAIKQKKASLLKKHLSKYLPDNIDIQQYFDEVQIADIPYYSFADRVAVLVDPESNRLSLSHTYKVITKYLLKFIKQ